VTDASNPAARRLPGTLQLTSSHRRRPKEEKVSSASCVSWLTVGGSLDRPSWAGRNGVDGPRRIVVVVVPNNPGDTRGLWALWSCGQRGRGHAVKGATIALDPAPGQVRPALDAAPARSQHRPTMEMQGRGHIRWAEGNSRHNHPRPHAPFPHTCAVGFVEPEPVHAVTPRPRGDRAEDGYPSC
jgi:hypothetical protein